MLYGSCPIEVMKKFRLDIFMVQGGYLFFLGLPEDKSHG